MSGMISAVTTVVTAAAGWVETYIGMIADDTSGILILGVVLSFAGFGIGVIKRLMSL